MFCLYIFLKKCGKDNKRLSYLQININFFLKNMFFTPYLYILAHINAVFYRSRDCSNHQFAIRVDSAEYHAL